MIKSLRHIALAVLIAVQAPAAVGQSLQSLIADRVLVDGNRLSAQGHVTIFMDDQQITASSVTYDRASGQLSLRGPLTITDNDGTTVNATSAELSPSQRLGLIQSARVVLAQRLQLAAADAKQVGDLTSLRQVAATTCHVCPGETALWEIRADEIVRDAAQQRIWFSGAHFRIKGVAVAPLPNMSLPEPGVLRAKGFLRPTFEQQGAAGLTARLPYFIPLGDDRDVTVAPRIGQRMIGLDLRYRQALTNGSFSAEAIGASGMRGLAQRGIWMRLSGSFSLADNWRLVADAETVSNRSFLKALGIDTRKQLDSQITLSRIQPRSLIYAQATHYTPLRLSGTAWDHPEWHIQGTLSGRRAIGGGFVMGGLSYDGHTHHTAPATPGQINQSRLSAHLASDHRWIVGPGVELGLQTRLQTDGYVTQPVGGLTRSGLRRQAHGALSLAWPLQARMGDTRHVVTPRLTLSASQISGFTPSTEDSDGLEYHLAGLHRFTQLPGEDQRATQRRAAISVDWTAQTGAGVNTRLSIGRLFQDRVHPAATPSTGLASAPGSWLLGAGGSGAKWHLGTQLNILDHGTIARAETRVSWDLANHNLSASHAFYRADSAAGRTNAVSELRLADGWQLTEGLRLETSSRLDLTRGEAIKTGLQLNWRRDCVHLKLSASHKHKSSFNLSPSNQFGFEISVDGFSTGSGSAPARSCSR